MNDDEDEKIGQLEAAAAMRGCDPTAELTGDAKLLHDWSQIKTPREMLQAVADASQFLGGDPYYADLVFALIENTERVLKETENG